MNYGQIRDRVVQYLAEYSQGAAESSSAASIGNDAIYARITDEYRKLIDEIATHDSSKVCVISSNITYAANTEYIDVDGTDTGGLDLSVATIVSVIEIDGVDRWPLLELTQGQFREAHRDGVAPYALEHVNAEHGWFKQANLLYVVPRPTRALTLRFEYVPEVADLSSGSDASNSPTYLPKAHHDFLACLVALSFKEEVGDVRGLERRCERMRRSFITWAAGSSRSGARYVRE